MPGLRERVIAAICAADWPHPDNEVNRATIRERLAGEGYVTSEEAVQQVLLQLSDQGDIQLVGEPGKAGGPAVITIREELCAEPLSDTDYR